MYLIDTDVIIDDLKDYTPAKRLLYDLASTGLAISLISYGELYEGVHYARDSELALRGLRTFMVGKELLPLTTATMEQFAITRGLLSRHQRQQIGDMDLLIAATAIHHNLTLLTRNRRHFGLVPDLKLFDESDWPNP